MEHYYSKTPSTEFIKKKIDFYIFDDKMSFMTSNSVFSKDKVDFGSRLLIETFVEDYDNQGEKGSDKTLLDVGCGYGPMALSILKNCEHLYGTMIDINDRAIELSKENARLNHLENRTEIFQSDLFDNVKETYDYVITNPPIRTGKANVHRIYELAYEHLNHGGQMYVVIQKKQGAPSSKEKMIDLFGNCEIIKKKSGYFILKSVKK